MLNSIKIPTYREVVFLSVEVLFPNIFAEKFADLKMIRTFAPLSTESTSDKGVLERWQSGRLRRS